MNGLISDTTVLEEGIAAADMEVEDQLKRQRERQECDQITWWLGQVDDAEKYDEYIRKGFVRDRLAARCITAHEVKVPLIGTSIDTLRSFLYARDPAVDCAPAQQVEPPADPMPVPPTPPAGLGAVLQDPMAAASMPGVVEGLGNGGLAGAAAAVGADVARQQAEYEQAQAAYQQQLAEWQAKQLARRVEKRQRQLFAQTLEIAITKAWKKGKMKKRARKMVVSTLTIGQGWLKLSWQEREITDPVISRQIQDLKSLLGRVAAQEESIREGGMSEEAIGRARLQIQQQLAAAQSRAVKTVMRGMSIEFVSGENMQVPCEVEYQDYLDGSWLCERIYKTLEESFGLFPDIDQAKLREAQRYVRTERDELNKASQNQDATVRAEDAGVYVPADGMANRLNHKPSDNDFIQILEIWSATDQNIYTIVRGVKVYPKRPAPPNVTSERFYGYFMLSLIDEDGQRAPASMTNRSIGLQDEYMGRRSALKKSRRRARPAVLFNATKIGTDAMNKIKASEEQEFVPVETIGDTPMSELFAPKPISQITPELYDTSPILRDFERVWGTQEALTGAVEVDKTATEADIQQTGFRSRTGDMRDQLEEVLTEMAEYTGVMLKEKYSLQDVMALCGPDAVWPELEDGESMEALMNTTIRAGSTGKPNNAKEREAWSAIVEPLMQGAVMIGQARGSTPQEIADKQEAILQESANRAGDNSVDITKFIPQNEGMLSGALPGQAPVPGAQPAAPGPLPPNPQEPVPSSPVETLQ